MTAKEIGDQPAFARSTGYESIHRDGMAMQGEIQSQDAAYEYEVSAQRAVQAADAVLAELAKEGQ